MKTAVIGCGRWGSFIAWYLAKGGHKVTVYGKENSATFNTLKSTKKNDLLSFEEFGGVCFSSDLQQTVTQNEAIVISINSQGLRGLMGEIKALAPKNKIFILCMKGLEIETGCRLSEIAGEYLSDTNKIAVWLGPGHVQEFCRGIPNCMVIDSKDEDLKKYLVENFTTSLIRFYYGQDLIGNEVGAAAKNVIGIAAGMLDGLNLTTLKGALMSRGTREISRLIEAMGGNPLSAYGLCHLGDYEATIFSPFSHNRKFGESFIKKETYTRLAEGFYTVKALMALKDKYGVELPICSSVYEILYQNADGSETLKTLFSRSLKNEI